MVGSPPDDPQQHEVYKLETEELNGHRYHKMLLRDLRKWARHTCKQFGVRPPRVMVKHNHGYIGVYLSETQTIQLDPEWGKNGLTLAHELAHHIVAVKHPRATTHGPTWLGYYAQILDMMRLVPADGVRAVARRRNVAISPAAPA